MMLKEIENKFEEALRKAYETGFNEAKNLIHAYVAKWHDGSNDIGHLFNFIQHLKP